MIDYMQKLYIWRVLGTKVPPLSEALVGLKTPFLTKNIFLKK